MRYHVINEVAYPKEMLEGSHYLSAILFRMEHPANPEEMMRAAQDVVVWFEKHPDGPPVKELFIELLLAGLTRFKVDPPPAIPANLQEVVTMIGSRFENWAIDHEKKGEQKGEAKILLRQLTRRFGELSAWVQEKINGADMNTLEMWSDRILDARTLEEVFDSNPAH